MNQIQLFKQNLLKKPYCTNYPRGGVFIRDTATALGLRYIQHNQLNSKLWLAYDIDRETSVDEITDDLGLPAPHFFIQNPKNQHAHALYALETPVHLNPTSSRRAIRFAGALDAGMTLKIRGDVGYAGFITKNPLHEHWRTWSTNAERYTLHELSQFVDLAPYKDLRKPLPDIGLARNCGIFDKLRLWAYKAIRQGWPTYDRFYLATYERGIMYNLDLRTIGKPPLNPNEIATIAKSVAKYVHFNFSSAGFRERQAACGAMGGAKSKGGGRPRQSDSERSLKPWEKLGISRATYYRKK